MATPQTTTLLPTTSDPSASDTGCLILQRYRILEKRGSGGFADVLICWDRRLRRRVAIKRIPIGTQIYSNIKTSTLDEALHEARTASMLSHPNIVTVYDFEIEGSYAFLVMEYIDGLNLEELMARVEGGVITYEECAHLLNCIASAVSFAHVNGVLHLDIKPANIMIDRQGNVKLTDFGMATLSSAAGYGDSRGGTIGYMPPEQIEGDLVDERCDVFALACVCWRALGGDAPFIAKSAEASNKKIAKGPKPALSVKEPPLAGPVEQTLRLAMAADPQKRLLSVSDLARVLVPALGDISEGQKSLANLLSQEDDEADDIPEVLMDHQALFEHIGWAWPCFHRVLQAICFGLISYKSALILPIPHDFYPQVLACIIGLVAGFFPTLGCALGIVSISAAVLCAGFTPIHTQPVFFVGAAAIFLLSFGAWWIHRERNHPREGLVAFLPFAIQIPFASMPYAVACLKPGQAFIYVGVGWLLEKLLVCFYTQANTAFLLHSLSSTLLDVNLWISCLYAGLISSLGALAQKRFARNGFSFPQVLVFLLLFGLPGITNWVENGGLYPNVDYMNCVFAVLLFGLMEIFTVLLGPDNSGQEADM